MAITSTAVWRVRPSGSNTNGGGFDCSLSSSATGSNGVISGTNTFTDTTAAAFTSGMTGSAINILGVGQFKFTFVSSTVGTLTIGGSGTLQPLGANGIKFSWTMGGGQDYSQQNTAQATGTLGTASGTTTFTDAGGAFTSAMVGNALWIASGSGFTVGAYFITAFGSSTSVTLDRSPGTGTVAHWAVGGGWADPFTNTTTSGPLVPGNICYLLGSGTPNPSSYTYDYASSTHVRLANGSNTAGYVTFANDPATPGYKAWPDTTGGMPVWKTPTSGSNAILLGNDGGYEYVKLEGIWFVNAIASTQGVIRSTSGVMLFGCVFDQFGFDSSQLATDWDGTIMASEMFSSVSAGAGSSYAIQITDGQASSVIGCNIHDCIGNGISLAPATGIIQQNIIAKCGAVGVVMQSGTGNIWTIIGNTIDGNGSDGIQIGTGTTLAKCFIYNNIISNHTTAGKFGLNIQSQTAAVNSLVQNLADYNVYYNNTSNYNAIGPGPHDTALSTSPYVSQSTENYTLA